MLIAIEGIDGSGKGTQTSALATRLIANGYDTLVLRFPQYDTSMFGKEVGRYLNGDFGTLEQVHPKFSALLYAMDRREAATQITTALSAGKTVICDRYTGSNIAHQCARVPPTQRAELAAWIRRVEEDILALPQADLVFLLDVEVHQSKAQVALKEPRSYTDRTHDLHEESENHLENAQRIFRELARDPRWVRVSCNDSEGKMRDRESITSELFDRAVHAGRK